VPADELIGYPFLDYDTAPCPTAAGPQIFDEPVEAPLLDEWPLLEWEPAVLEEDLLDGCYYW
jgi:hypothetical protein